jgi:hypothetical protein
MAREPPGPKSKFAMATALAIDETEGCAEDSLPSSQRVTMTRGDQDVRQIAGGFAHAGRQN